MQTHNEQQPDPGRRRLLQFSAGAAARSVLPPLPIGSVVKTATATVATAVTAVTENYGTFMAMSLSQATWKLNTNYASPSLYPNYRPETYDFEVMRNRLRRLSELFSFYTLHNEQQISSAQKTQSWKNHLMYPIEQEMILKTESPDKISSGYSHDLAVFSEGKVTQKQILKRLIGLVDEILSATEAAHHKHEMHVYDDRDGSYQGLIHMSELDSAVFNLGNEYFTDFKPSMVIELSVRQKIELLLEFSHADTFMNPIPRHAGSRHHWFEMPTSFPPMKLLEGEELERGMTNNILDLYREKVAPFQTLPEQYQSLYEDNFSVDEYFQRRDILVNDLDLLFARRGMKKRLEMKQVCRQETVAIGNKDVLSAPPASLLRSVVAVRSAFSRVSDSLSGLLRAVFTEKVVPISDAAVETKKNLPLALEYNPSDTIGQIDLQALNNQESLVPLSRTSPQP